MACIDIQERTLMNQSDFLTGCPTKKEAFVSDGEIQIQYHHCYNLFSYFAFLCALTLGFISGS